MIQLKNTLIVIFVLTIVVCSAEPPRYRQSFTARKSQPIKQRSPAHQKRVLAKQEAVTPYPAADELKPEVPFEDGNTPDEVYGPPDEVYGPPDANQSPADQLPSEDAPEEFAPNPDAEEFQTTDDAPFKEPQVSRLLERRKANKKSISSRLVQKNKIGSQRLLIAPVQTNAARVSIVSPISYTSKSQQFLLSNQPFAYTDHYKVW